MAKKSWLYLFDYLVRNEELLKAVKLPVPWSLEEDADMAHNYSIIANHLRYLSNPELLKRHIVRDEGRKDMESIENDFKNILKIPRAAWIKEQVISFNPERVLDIGAGFGEITVEIAKLQIAVTAISPFEEATFYAKEIQRERNLAIHWMHDLFENLQFEDESYDVVLACEILEHIVDDRAFLEKALRIAKRGVILTTPYGCTTKGFFHYSWRNRLDSQHVRAYSEGSLRRLLADMPGCNVASFDVRATGVTPFGPMECFCVVLEKVEENKEAEVLTHAGTNN